MSPQADRYALLGNPVEHSRSPFIHAEFARLTGEPVAYERVLCPLDGFVPGVQRLAAEGARGCNITVPFKFEAFGIAPRRSERAALARAANLLRFDAQGWYADNTDGVGLVRDIEANAGRPIAGRRVLLVGAGGAAAGVLGPLIESRPAALQLVNRTADKAAALARTHQALAEQLGVRLAAGGLSDAGEGFDIVLNASASSLQGVQAPVGASVLKPGTLALDLMYGPAAQGFLQWAGVHGAQVRDGLGMLIEQAAEAFWVWRGVRPPTEPVLQALRRQVDAA